LAALSGSGVKAKAVGVVEAKAKEKAVGVVEAKAVDIGEARRERSKLAR